MDFLLHRYRNFTVLLVVILAQLVLLAYQVKSSGEVRLIRVWAVSAVTPLARVIEGGRSRAAHFVRDYFLLLDVRSDNQKLKTELDRVHMENQYLRSELNTADRAKSLALFQQRSRSTTLAAHVISNTNSTGEQVVIIDRGSLGGVQKSMAVITPDGIVGKVISVYPTASFVRLITDPTFSAGVISQKNGVRGMLRGQGQSSVIVDKVQNEQNVEPGEWFYTSGDDLIFPKGLPVGAVTVVRPGSGRKDIFLAPSGLENGLEEVLVILEGVHDAIPERPGAAQPVHIQPPLPADVSGAAAAGPPIATTQGGPVSTDADRVTDLYRRLGEAQKHDYGRPGGVAPNYNLPLPAASAAPAAPADSGKAGPSKRP